MALRGHSSLYWYGSIIRPRSFCSVRSLRKPTPIKGERSVKRGEQHGPLSDLGCCVTEEEYNPSPRLPSSSQPHTPAAPVGVTGTHRCTGTFLTSQCYFLRELCRGTFDGVRPSVGRQTMSYDYDVVLTRKDGSVTNF